MNISSKKSLAIAIMAASLVFQSCKNEPKAPHIDPLFSLPALVSDGMVLQRDTELNIWGKATVGSEITVSLNGVSSNAITDENGKWNVVLPAQNAGGPFDMAISYNRKHDVDSLWYNYSDTLRNILIGEVWLCSGQSNMELPIRRVQWKYPGVVENSTNTNIRYFEVPKTCFFKNPLDTLPGNPQWKEACPENISEFSSLGYFFAKDINEKLNVPVGIILSAKGGSPAEAWISEEKLETFKNHYAELQKLKDDSYIQNIKKSEFESQKAWADFYQQNDLGISENWQNPDTDTKKWKTVNIPCYMSATNIKFKSGVVWFERKINITAEQANKKALLVMGVIVDADQIYVNGTFVGTTSYMYPPRRYQIPEGVLHEGENTIAVRLTSNGSNGGFVPDKDYIIDFGTDTLDISGKWSYKLGVEGVPPTETTFFEYKPAGLYNAMIAPILGYKFKGVIWYQGESNAEHYEEYYYLLQTLITDWREKFNCGDFPFIVVQLPLFMQQQKDPSNGDWANMRDIQHRIAKETPNTYCVCTIDLGEWNDIHPLKKQQVANRVSLMAQNVAYNKNVVASGPTIKSMTSSGNTAVLTFDNIGSGLVSIDNKPLRGFAVAGDDCKFYWADAVISGNNIKVSSKKVKDPIIVQYAWADNPGNLNLYNKEGLPAMPFSIIE
ncbi:MAG: beta galactosidase jelly roll domain-containing protein [Bacteroidales bacterium]|nr:beta galactosidase jelly roll domain-containing protein [Bacteroidales bacterium]